MDLATELGIKGNLAAFSGSEERKLLDLISKPTPVIKKAIGEYCQIKRNLNLEEPSSLVQHVEPDEREMCIMKTDFVNNTDSYKNNYINVIYIYIY